MRNVNWCLKGISLGAFFFLRKNYGKIITQLIFSTVFYISHENDVKTFLM